MMPKNERLVLRTLAGHADAADKCYPSVPTLADECGMAAATARAALHALIAKHWLFISDGERLDADGARTSNEYTLTPERGEWWPDDAREHLARPTPQARRLPEPTANGATALVSSGATTTNGATGAPQTAQPPWSQAAQPPWSQAARDKAPMEAPSEEPTEAPIAQVPAGAGAREAAPARPSEQSFALTPPGPKKRKAPTPRSDHPMPNGWQHTPEHEALAKREGVNLEAEEERFRFWAEGKVSSSWNGRFSTWLLKSGKDRRDAGDPPYEPPPPRLKIPLVAPPPAPLRRMTFDEARAKQAASFAKLQAEEDARMAARAAEEAQQ